MVEKLRAHCVPCNRCDEMEIRTQTAEARLETSTAKLKTKLRELESQVRELTERLAESRAEVLELTAQRDKWEVSSSYWQGHCENADKLVAELRATIERLERELADRRKGL